MANQDDLHNNTAKQRSLRIELQQSVSQDPIRMRKRRWAFAFALAALVYATWSVLGIVNLGGKWSAGGAMQNSPGALASVHATWDNQCDACHLAGAPLRDDSQAMRWVGQAWHFTSVQFDVDQKCSACHLGNDGRGMHHANQLFVDAVRCSACHQDHRGRTASMARSDDAHCLRCHNRLNEHRTNTEFAAAPIENVTAFATHDKSNGGHPLFRSLKAGDPGTIHFNHAFHLLPSSVRNQFRPQPAKGTDGVDAVEPIALHKTLDCQDCHELDGAQTANRAAAGPRLDVTVPAAGAYMRPISFDRHCKSCHELTVPGELAVQAGPVPTVPHGLSLAQTRQAIVGLIAGRAADGTAPAAERFNPNRPIPGKTPGQNLAQSLPTDLSSVASDTLAILASKSCYHCHKAADRAEDASLPDIAQAQIPQVWLQLARFDHSKHRDVKCSECHPAAFPQPAAQQLYEQKLTDRKKWQAANTDKKDEITQTVKQLGQLVADTSSAVMVPNIDNCLRCHAPRDADKPAGGARFDCAECHRYHGGELQPHGPGHQLRGVEPATPRRDFDAANRKTIQDFVRGAEPTSSNSSKEP